MRKQSTHVSSWLPQPLDPLFPVSWSVEPAIQVQLPLPCKLNEWYLSFIVVTSTEL